MMETTFLSRNPFKNQPFAMTFAIGYFCLMLVTRLKLNRWVSKWYTGAMSSPSHWFIRDAHSGSKEMTPKEISLTWNLISWLKACVKVKEIYSNYTESLLSIQLYFMVNYKIILITIHQTHSIITLGKFIHLWRKL